MKKFWLIIVAIIPLGVGINQAIAQTLGIWKEKEDLLRKQSWTKEVKYVRAGFLITTHNNKVGYYGLNEWVIFPDKYTKIDPIWIESGGFGRPEYYFVYIGNSLGLCNYEGKEIVSPGRYTKIGKREKSRYPVWRGNRVGLIDDEGNELISPQKYSDIQIVRKDIFVVFSGHIAGICDSKGKEIIKPTKYTKIEYDEDGGIYIVFVGDKAGVCDANGKELLSPSEYADISYNRKFDWYWVRKGTNWGVLNNRFSVIVPANYTKTLFYADNNFFEVYDRDRVGIFRDGHEVISPTKYTSISYDSKNRYYKVKVNETEGICSNTGKEIIAPQFNYIDYIDSLQLFIVKNGEWQKDDEKYGVINKDGFTITNVEYDWITPLGEGLLKTVNNGKCGCISISDGQIVLPFEYDDIGNFKNGVAMVSKGGQSFMIPNPLSVVSLNQGKPMKKGRAISTYHIPDSEVDNNIPTGRKADGNTHAFIVANENYPTAKVPYALNDGWTFEKYCKQTLGIKDENVHIFEDATGGNIMACVEQMKQASKASDGMATIIFYYAGHAFPDEASKSGYLLPIDGDSKNIATGYSLEKLYKELNSISAKQIVCFIDACFSGTTREDNMLIAGRGVAIKVNDEVPQGNMVVFTSATGAETAHSYEEMHHGLFTYYLLEKLQQTKGNVTLGELSEYVTKMVKRKSVLINQKKQTPTVIPSPQQQTTWQNIKL